MKRENKLQLHNVKIKTRRNQSQRRIERQRIISNVEFHRRKRTKIEEFIKLEELNKINVEIAKKNNSYNIKNFNNEFLNINIPNRQHTHNIIILNIT